MKGQMFLVAAIVIVSSIVIIKFNMASSSATREVLTMKVRFEDKVFENLENEFNNTMSFSSDIPTNITRNVFDFANFTESKINAHSMSLRILYLGVTANKTTNYANTTLINMLDEPIDAKITINGQTEITSDIEKYEQWDRNFTITPGTEYTLTLVYNITSGNNSTSTTESITVNTKKHRDMYTGFFYIMLKSPDATHVRKYTKSINI